jgi:hypothetical protein
LPSRYTKRPVAVTRALAAWAGSPVTATALVAVVDVVRAASARLVHRDLGTTFIAVPPR